MPSIIRGFENDIFVSYRHKDNHYDGWVTDFVTNLKRELESTTKETLNVYYDKNSIDGLLEVHHVDHSVSAKLKSLIIIPIISQTYCDENSFAWNNEFLAFNEIASNDQLGKIIKLADGNMASRILQVKIHELDIDDQKLLEGKMQGSLRAIDFIYNSPGVNRPLRPRDDDEVRENQLFYRNQINKVANAVKNLIGGIKERHAKNPITLITTKEKVKPEKIAVAGVTSAQISFRVKIIQQVEIFSRLKTELLEKIAASIEVFNLESGHRLIEKGEQGSAMYIIVDGKVKVHDEEHLFSYLSGGDCFGEYTLIDEKHRSASVTILEKTTLFRLSIDVFQELISKNSVFIQGVLEVLVDRLRNLDKVQTQLSISNQKLKDQSQKIAEKNQELNYFNQTRTRVLSIVAEDLNKPIQEIIKIINKIEDLGAEKRGKADSIDAVKVKLVKIEEIIKQLLNFKNWGTGTSDN